MGLKRGDSLENTSKVFDAMASFRQPMNAKEVSLQAGLPLSTTHSLLTKLVGLHFLTKCKGKYFISPKFFACGSLYNSRHRYLGQLQSACNDLAKETLQTCSLVQLIGTSCMTIYESKHSVHALPLGVAFSITQTIVGRIFASKFIPLQDYLCFDSHEVEFLQFQSEVKEAHKQGYFCMFSASDYTMSAPVLSNWGKTDYALCLHLPQDSSAQERKQSLQILVTCTNHLVLEGFI